jgi:hypothetical protein
MNLLHSFAGIVRVDLAESTMSMTEFVTRTRLR